MDPETTTNEEGMENGGTEEGTEQTDGGDAE